MAHKKKGQLTSEAERAKHLRGFLKKLFWGRERKAEKKLVESEIDKNTRVEGSIFYHEDDYCQIEIVPKENFSELIKQAENVAEFSEAHAVGEGYSDIYVREGEGFPLREKGITINELDSILSKLSVKRHDSVTTGYSQDYRVFSENTIGYGEGYSAFYFDYGEGVVEDIWITHFGEIDRQEVVSVLVEMGSKWGLLLMDWNSLELIDLSNEKQITKYVLE